MKDRGNFARWFFDRFLDFQRRAGRPITEKEFGEDIGLPKNVTNNLMKGRNKPSASNLALVDARYPGAYEAAGIRRPSATADPRLAYILNRWGKLDEEQIKEIMEVVERAIARNGEQEPAEQSDAESVAASGGKQ